MSKLNQILDLIRGIVKPIITGIGFTAVTIAILFQIDVPEWYRSTIIAMIAFWFGNRSNRTPQ